MALAIVTESDDVVVVRVEGFELLEPMVSQATSAAATAVDARDETLAALPRVMLNIDVTPDAAWALTLNGTTARGDRGLNFSSSSGNSSAIEAQFAPATPVGSTDTYVFICPISPSFTRPISGRMGVIKQDNTYAVRALAADPRVTIDAANDVMRVEIDYLRIADDKQMRPAIFVDGPTSFVDGEWIEVESVGVSVKVPSQSGVTGNTSTLDLILTATLKNYATKFGLGDIREQVAASRAVAGGAEVDGRWAMIFPTGQDGAGSTFSIERAIDAAGEPGRVKEFLAAFAKSATFTRTLAPLFQVQLSPLVSPTPRDADIELVFEDDDLSIFLYRYTVEGDEYRLLPTVQQTSAIDTLTDERLELVGFFEGNDSAIRPWLRPSDETLADYVGARIGGVPSLRPYRVIEADDFASLADAMASITDASPGFWYRINLGRSVYELTEQLVMKPYVEIVGKGPRDSIIRLFQPNNTPAEDIIANSVIDFRVTGLLKGLRVEGKNCQYGVHCDTTGQIFNTVTAFENVEIAHYGNLGADFPNAWPAQNAIGAGASGGQLFTIEGCYLWAKNGVSFSLHNNMNASNPCRVELLNSVFATDVDNGLAIIVNAIGSRQADEWYMENCVIGGRWTFSVANWFPPEVPDNRFEFAITVANCSPSVFTNGDPGATGMLMRPIVTNEDVEAVNDTGSTIPMGAVCVPDGSPYKMRLMTDADDPAVLRPHVARRSIPDGESGPFKKAGYLPLGGTTAAVTGTSDILRSDNAAFAFGDTFSIDPSNDGKIVKGGTQAIFRAIRDDAVEFGRP